MNWLLTADWHLPPRPATVGWAGIPECREDEWTALQDVVELCVQRKAHLAVAGDIFDAPQIAPRCLDRLFDTLKPLQENALQCVYILGNHDAGFDWLRNVPQTQSVRRGLQRIDETTVSGVDFCDDFTPPQLPIVSDLGLYHQAWKELTKRGSYAIAELPAHRVSVCGDIHISQLFTYEQSYRPPRFALSPGPVL